MRVPMQNLRQQLPRPSVCNSMNCTDLLCVWWQDSVCYDFVVGSGTYDSEIYWNITHPLTEESWAGGGAPDGPVTLCGSDSMPPTDSPTMTPVPTPATWSPTSSEPTSTCPETCFGETCDFWDGQAGSVDGCDYAGGDLESYYGCFCGGCACDTPSPTAPPTLTAVLPTSVPTSTAATASRCSLTKRSSVRCRRPWSRASASCSGEGRAASS